MFDSCLSEFGCRRRQGKIQRPVKPKVVFADEPTSRLDPVTQKDTFRCLLEELKAAGCALLLVTHDKALATKTAHRTLTLAPLAQPG